MNIEERVNNIEKELEDIKKEIKESKEENKKWMPKIDEIYWYVDIDVMEVDWCYYRNDNTDNIRLNQNRIFKTEKEAEEYLEYLMEKEKYINTFTDEEWRDDNICKYYILYSYYLRKLEISDNFIYREVNKACFRTEEEAQDFINKYEKQILHEIGIE